MNQAIANYLFLHRELIKVMNAAFCGYPDGYYFVPPSSYITDRYERLLNEYLNLESNRNRYIEDEIDRLPLVSLKGIRSLSEHFDENIPLWRSLKESLDDDLVYIQEKLPVDYVIPDKLRVIAYELKEALEYHEQKKQKLLAQLTNKQPHTSLLVDKDRSILLLGGKSYDIELLNKPFLFLSALLAKQGIVVNYKELAQSLELNAYHEGVTDRDIKREVQEVKKALLLQLKSLGVPAKQIDRISVAIKPKKGMGYRLDTISL
ncbi:MAG: hypothetical protein Q8L37_05525 [Candidatus Gottesmanbacteria bacterium]|nr:hypothetical protein [Candidatus Gottesmanbacteria bacterium]